MIKRTTDCSLVQDLLPLYIEHLVSEESAQKIAAHTVMCAECRHKLELLTSELPDDSLAEAEETESIHRIMRRAFWRERLTGAIAMLLVYVILTLSLLFISSSNQLRIPASSIDVGGAFLMEQPDGEQAVISMIRVDPKYQRIRYAYGGGDISDHAEVRNLSIYTSILPPLWNDQKFTNSTQYLIVQSFPPSVDIRFCINQNPCELTYISEDDPRHAYLQEILDRTASTTFAADPATLGIDFGQDSLILKNDASYEEWSYDGALISSGTEIP